MPFAPEAFRHHPGLAGKIRDPEESFFRYMVPAEMDARMAALGVRTQDWRYPDAERERMREATLSSILAAGEGLWVFAYGSLMWDPAFYFDEVRRAEVRGFRRHFCLVDTSGARGTEHAPGLMAALAPGGCCEGLVFHLSAETAARESEIVWRREMIGPGYTAEFIPVETAQGRVQALAFVMDPEKPLMQPEIRFQLQVEYCRTGSGFLGTSREYLENVVARCRDMQIHDPDLERLLEAVEACPPH